MKTTALATLFALLSCVAHAESPIERKLQQALFAEEGTRDLDKAIEAYNAVITDYDAQRKFAATAIFRLAECHRKKDQKESAIAAYQRLLREFPEEATLVRLAHENLNSLGSKTPAEPAELATSNNSEAAEIARLQKLVELSPDLLNDPQTGLLHEAVAKSQLKVAKFLIDSGADVNLHCTQGNRSGEVKIYGSPLSVAAENGHLAMAEFLLAQGAKLDSGAINNAVANQRTAVLELLLNSLPEEHDGIVSGQAVHLAVENRRADYLEKLLAEGGRGQAYHLEAAIKNGDVESARLLIESGVETTPDHLLSAIDVSRDGQLFDLVWATGIRDQRALAHAIRLGRPETTEKMIASKAEIDAPDEEGGQTVLCLAAGSLWADAIKAALAGGADPNAKDGNGDTPLICATKSSLYGDYPDAYEKAITPAIGLLLDAGADIDARDRDGMTALLHAGQGHQISINRRPHQRFLPDAAVERLLAAKPDPNLQGIWEGTALTAGHPLVRLYAALRIPERPKHTWLMSNSVSSVATDRPARLSELILIRSTPSDITAQGLRLQPFNPIIAIYGPGETEPQEINYDDIVAGGDPSADPLIALGTIVSVEAAADREVSEATAEFLLQAASKNVTVTRGDQRWKGVARPGSAPPLTPYDPSLRIAHAKTVVALLNAIHAPLDTSDLTRIEVRHSDGETSVLNYLIAKNNAEVDLPLRDSDEIVLHPIGGTDLSGSIWLSRESELFLRRLHPAGGSWGVDLADFVASAYADSTSVLPAPDLASINILRGGERMQVNLYELGAEKPFGLAAGDIVDIPALAEPQQSWQQLDDRTVRHLQNILGRKAVFETVGGSSRELLVGPQFYHFPLSDGLRKIEAIQTDGDAAFEVVGLSTEVAIRSLGYEANAQLKVRYQQFQGETRLADRRMPDEGPRPVSPFPLIEAGNRILIFMSSANESRSQSPRAAAPRDLKATAIPSVQPSSTRATIPAPSQDRSSSGRRVVLPPKSR